MDEVLEFVGESEPLIEASNEAVAAAEEPAESEGASEGAVELDGGDVELTGVDGLTVPGLKVARSSKSTMYT